MAHTSQNKLSQPANMRRDSKTIPNTSINLNGAVGAQSSVSEENLELQQRLEKFVGTFVTEIDTKFGVYQTILEGGKNADGKSCSKDIGEGIGSSAVNLLGYITPVPAGLANIGGKLGGVVAEELGQVIYKNKLTCLSQLIYSYQNNKDVQKKVLVEVGVQVFRSFEMQIMGMGGKRAWEISVIMFGKDAAQRAINFCAQESVEEFTVKMLTIGVLQGRSRKQSSWIPWKRGLNIEYQGTEVTTEDIFTLVGIVDIENEIYYAMKDEKNNVSKCGYRILFSWETNDSKSIHLQCYKKLEKPPENKYKYMLQTKKCNAIQEKITATICAKEWHPTEETIVSVLREIVDEIMDTVTSKVGEELEQIKKLIAEFDGDYAKQQVILVEREKNILHGVERECSLTREHTSQEMHWTRAVIQKDLSEKYEVILQGIEKDGIKTRSLVSEKLGSGAKRKLFILPFSEPVETRIMREGVLNQLHSYLHTLNVKRMVVVCGLGGVGKTELTREYAQNHCKEYDNIVWINAESYDSLCHSFMDAAQKLKVQTMEKMCDSPTERSITDIARDVYDELDDNKCLFIFDDAQKYRGEDTDAGLANFFPSRSVKNFYVIITSCTSDWDPSVPRINLEVFEKSESLHLLKKLLGNKYEESDARHLSELVGHLPLGLQIAAAYINDQNITISTLLEECKQEKTDILKLTFPSSSMDNSKKNIFTTFQVIIDTFCNQYGQEAVTILNILAYLNPRNVPEDWFSSLGEEIKIRNIILALKRYSFIVKRLNEPSFNIQKSVQEVIRKKLGDHEEFDALKTTLDFLKLKKCDKNDNVIEQHVEHVWQFTCNHMTLVKGYYDILDYPLHRAAQLNYLDMVKYLIKEKEVYVYTRDRSGMTPLYRANQLYDNIEVISYLISESVEQHTNQHEDDWKVLKKAAQENKQAIVKFLINESGADPFLEKNRLLCLAAQNGRLDVVTFLLENGADILFRSSNGVTILHEAVVSNNCTLIEFVLDQIGVACRIRSEEISNYINAQDRVGDTPLMWAAEAWKVDVVKVLRSHGADIGVKNMKNKTACDLANQTTNELLQ